jgi:hypothetical protein
MSVRQETAVGEPPVTGVLPINLVLNLFEALKVARSNRSPWIGISVLELPVARRRLAGHVPAVVVPTTGVYIDDVFDPSPAHKAGIRPGDFLLGLGGHRVLAVGDFQTWLYVAGVDAKVDLDIAGHSPFRSPSKRGRPRRRPAEPFPSRRSRAVLDRTAAVAPECRWIRDGLLAAAPMCSPPLSTEEPW